MKCAQKRNQREIAPKSTGVSGEEKKVSHLQTKKERRGKGNSCRLSYVEVIANAILSSPRTQRTLSEIYSFIQHNYPEFTENRVRWKNTVRHNLSLQECFQRGEVAYNKGGCYWGIHPKFLPNFSRGDFTRRPPAPTPQIVMQRGYLPFENDHFSAPNQVFHCNFCELPPSLSSYDERMIHGTWAVNGCAPYRQHPYFSWDHCMY